MKCYEAVKAYDRLVEMMNTMSTKIVDHSEVVPPDVYWEQDKQGRLDKESLAEEINTIAEMIIEFASDIADEALEKLTSEDNDAN